MRSHSAVLLDCDGLLVDNVEFEKAVTLFLVEHLASSSQISVNEATIAWEQELLDTKGSPSWYDYDFHCQRLGLPKLAREAHRAARHLLVRMPEAEKTYAMLLETGIKLGVATDAVRWVVEFKLESLDFPKPNFILSSDSMSATKSSPRYWQTYREQYPTDDVCIFADNRVVNLDTAGSVLPDADLICFVGDEHVLQLSGIVGPNEVQNRISETPIDIVADHYELMEQIIDFLVQGKQ
ncbi:hypothetical protein [Saccharothrix sp. NRRL B-16348]|uniref:hypothetical protein n=1 Tax=Saccharothrix sp. NRRL B-16348 TaxID=1415542 RepID=UPI000A8AA719|nr:hypothetical protein [Saccharothrix sp. NRRL B-16348]